MTGPEALDIVESYTREWEKGCEIRLNINDFIDLTKLNVSDLTGRGWLGTTSESIIEGLEKEDASALAEHLQIKIVKDHTATPLAELA